MDTFAIGDPPKVLEGFISVLTVVVHQLNPGYSCSLLTVILSVDWRALHELNTSHRQSCVVNS